MKLNQGQMIFSPSKKANREVMQGRLHSEPGKLNHATPLGLFFLDKMHQKASRRS